MSTAEKNLSIALAILAIRHQPSRVEGKRDWFAKNGDYIGTYDAYEGWMMVRRITLRIMADEVAA
ncbi:hypothetical protein [Phyllobacterium chamaecytisi]|uniref:hypothetical protein n=1 Tax=Phyllobacterium chamaecytisi TaxID=2876082 RepID=UPI001CCD3151|nr:hypothetical protein [Phyllobacterium sp. KW56]MBZ9600706.1 hypothetical protein [Phyllobacterium sp. KW56]